MLGSLSQLIKGLSGKRDDLSSNPQHLYKNSDMCLIIPALGSLRQEHSWSLLAMSHERPRLMESYCKSHPVSISGPYTGIHEREGRREGIERD